MVLRVNRLMRVRSVRLLRSMRWVNILPARYHRTSLPSRRTLYWTSAQCSLFISTVQQPEEQTVFLRKALLRCLPELAKQHGTATGITHRFDFRRG